MTDLRCANPRCRRPCSPHPEVPRPCVVVCRRCGWVHTLTVEGEWVGWGLAAMFSWLTCAGGLRRIQPRGLPRHVRRRSIPETLRSLCPPN